MDFNPIFKMDFNPISVQLFAEKVKSKRPCFMTKPCNSLEISTLVPMGGIQRAGTGKNKKVTEIFPLLAFWPEGLGIKFL